MLSDNKCTLLKCSIDTLPKLRVGIIGAARVARKNISAIEHPASSCVVSALASRNWDHSSSFVKDFCSSHAEISVRSCMDGTMNGYADLVEGEENICDAVYIPLPVSMHKEWAIRALNAGKHVLIEKPVAVRYEDYVEMMEVAKENGKYLQDGTMFVHNPRLEAFTSCVCDEAQFGEIRRVNASFTFLGDDDFLANDIRTKRDLDPLGCIGDLGWYCVRAGVVLFSRVGAAKVNTVQVVQSTTNEEGVPLDATCLVAFEGGRLLSFHCSFLHTMRQSVEVVSSKKSASIKDFVVPKRGCPTRFEVHEQGFQDRDKHFVETTTTMQFEAGPPQDVIMWRTFSRLAREIDESVKLEKASGKNGWGDNKAVDWAYRFASVSLETQKIVSALMDSLENDGKKIDMRAISKDGSSA